MSDVKVGEKNCTVTKMAVKYNQESYAVVVCSIQPKCIFLQRVIEYMGHMFAGMEKLTQEILLTCIFYEKSKSLPSVLGTLSTMPVNKYGLFLKYLVTSANNKYHSLRRVISDLIGTVLVAS